MNITFYCNSFNGIAPYKSQFNQRVLMCGAHSLSREIRDKCIEQNYLFDDTHDNISNLNYLLGDLTGLYWVWKNTNDEFVGMNQYRRFYDDQQIYDLKELQKNTLYVSNFLGFNYNVWDQYVLSHGDLGLKLLYKAIELNKVPISKDMFNRMYSIKILSSCNSFFAHRNTFDRICLVLFEIIFELYNGSKYLLDFVQNNMHIDRHHDDKRLLAFLAERILTIIYFNSEYFLEDTKIVPINFNLCLLS